MTYDPGTAIDKVCGMATSFRPFVFSLVTLAKAGEVTIPNRKLRVAGGNPSQVELIDGASNPVATWDLGPVKAWAGMISRTAFARTQYTEVRNDGLFERLYDVKDRPLAYIEAGTQVQKQVSSAPCMICGLVLPLRNLTVDHQRPQKGGEIEAVLKTFRAFGLTVEGPRGAKGKAILANLTEGKALGPAPTRSGRAPLGGSADPTGRYSLNDSGSILYSFVAAAAQTAELKAACMHGLLNLKPACGACNSSRGNPLKFNGKSALMRPSEPGNTSMIIDG